MASEIIELSGHIIDSWTLPRAWDIIMDRGGDFLIQEIQVGKHKSEPSYVRMEIKADDEQTLDLILSELQQLGAMLVNGHDVRTARVEQRGVLPEGFYSTTNLPTQVRLGGQWVDVEHIEMDVAIVIDREHRRAYCKPMHEVEVGDEVVVGHEGIRVQSFERAREREIFAFMQSDVSSEKAKILMIQHIARQMQETRARGGKILFVLGPAVIHTGAGRYVAELIRRGYVQVIFGGNAIVTHDVEAALFGTSLGVDLRTGEQVEGGHRNHLRAINAIRAVGSLEKAVEVGLLREGLIYEAIKHQVPLVLAGSIRDDGPMPGVITDMQEAQRQMRRALPGVEMAIMVASMLHAIATGNLLPATVRTVVVDINPAVVTKLADRGSFQAAGLVTDAELFLRELVEALRHEGAFPDAAGLQAEAGHTQR
ncbi:TIGR00300 family protein [Thermogemmatispora aurantia]|jgi:lysine-ketoglutarate reductase/saccharopine dehydrogenase-like protein (TIGR00300 family)|uniref:ornithine cyclodeaminase n=2 Tax=Thermogemmatispora TaxID=768669 RepID=A0A5J4K3Y4_9CHLR|nr:TIGR00300 family protein [Thermogemmatispora aurantia]GER83374.1 TIGR00300 family protein [Thermogemmatispora aurantia]